jgi:[NiFe] hydrogenase diaphorase moiety large subunit
MSLIAPSVSRIFRPPAPSPSLNNSRDMFEVARNYVHFFQHESCGFCTPCRVGTSLLKNLMDKLHNGCGSPYDFAEIEN